MRVWVRVCEGESCCVCELYRVRGVCVCVCEGEGCVHVFLWVEGKLIKFSTCVCVTFHQGSDDKGYGCQMCHSNGQR